MDEEVAFDDIVSQFESSTPKFIEPEEAPEDEDQGEEVPEDGPQGDDEDEAEEGAEEGDEEGSDSGSEDQGEEDPETEVTLGGETKKVKLSELKALYAQQEEVTGRVKAIQEQNRAVEAQGLYLAKLYEARLISAQAAVDRYKNIDLFQAYRELDADEFETLKSAKEAAEAEYATVTAEAQDFMNRVVETKRTYLREQAKHSIAAIRQAIPDWNDAVYNKVRTYAVAQGMDMNVVNEIVDAPAIIMMHKAMLYDDTKSKAETVTKKVVKAPKKVVKKGDTPTDTEATAKKRLIANARESGSIDDVAEAFLAAQRRK